MTAGNYRIKVYLTGLDKERAKELRYVMADYIRGAGKAKLRDMMRRAHEGEQVLLYESNSDDDAEAFVRAMRRAGAQIAIEGLRPEDEPF